MCFIACPNLISVKGVCDRQQRESEILQMEKKELSTIQLSSLAKIQCTGNSPAKWVELGRYANMHISTQNNKANMETSRGTNYLLYFLP